MAPPEVVQEDETARVRERLPTAKKNRGFKLSLPPIAPSNSNEPKSARGGPTNGTMQDSKGFMTNFFSPRTGRNNPTVVPFAEEVPPENPDE